MTDTEKKSMEQHAREHAASLERMVELADKVRNANDSDDIDPDDWDAICSEFDLDPECENCGQTFSGHVAVVSPLIVDGRQVIHMDGTPITQDVRFCNEDDDDDDQFFIRHLGDMYDETIREYFEGLAYGSSVTIKVNVEMYGGGPAGGVMFDCDKGQYGLELNYAEVWHQDWFEPKGFARLDDSVAESLFQLWGIEYVMGDG